MAAVDAGALTAWPFRRFPTLVETTARVDYPALSGAFDDATAHVTSSWAGLRARHVDALLAQAGKLIPTEPTTNVSWVDKITLPPLDATVLFEAIVWAVELGQQGAISEAKAQGATLPAPPDAHEIADQADAHTRAAALERLLAGQLVQIVKREGMRLAGARADAVLAVSRVLGDKPTPGEVATLKSASHGGVNEGRLSVIRMIRIGTSSVQAADGDPPTASEQVGYLYATELLDDHTCDPCGAIDGTQYDSLEAAQEDYPGLGGGYVWCDGREACRGSLVVVYADVVPPTVDGGSSQAQAIADRAVRDAIKQDAIARREQADAREAFRGLPPPAGGGGGAPATPPPPPPRPFSGIVTRGSADQIPKVGPDGQLIISPGERAAHEQIMQMGRAIATIADQRIAARSVEILADRPGPAGEKWFFDKLGAGEGPSEAEWQMHTEQVQWDHTNFDGIGENRTLGNDEKWRIEQQAITEATEGRVTFGEERISLGRSTRRPEVVAMAKRLPDGWVRASNADGQELSIKRAGARSSFGPNRSYYSRNAGVRDVGSAGFVRYDEIVMADRASSDVVLHELVHRIEAVLPELRRAEYVFSEYRARGKTWDGVREAAKLISRGAKHEEWAIPDEWREIYSGKDYTIGTGLPPAASANVNREIATVGMQTLAGGPGTSLQLSASVIRADEEYRAWMLGVLALLGA